MGAKVNRIPVGTVISQTFEFAFRRYFSLLGVLWLWMLLSLISSYFLLLPHLEDAAAGSSHFPHGLAVLAGEILQMAIIAVNSVGVTKEALGLREGPRFVYLAVGTAELRVLGGMLLLGLVSFVVIFALGIGGGIVIAIVAAASGDRMAMTRAIGIATPILILGIFLLLLYLWIRLSSFQTAVAVREHRFGLWRSWELSRNNFWRLLAIVLVVWIPLVALEAVLVWFMTGPALMKVIAAAAVGPEAMRAAQSQLIASALSMSKYGMLVFLPISPIIYALMISPGAFAYRALAPSGTDAAATFD